MRKASLQSIMITAAGFLLSAPLPASDVDHYEGKKAETLEEAVTNLREYNGRLETVLEKEELSAEDHAQVHRLSYTLENALQRIEKELPGIAADLESVHLASERQESETVRMDGENYLKQVDTLID
ncbi:DUF6746 family protein [Halofilum ochraceum]|uniref:DUF6746 family protein n=1 Tax=Halofilum ochraceum TaxID=1611323 RepID=UPI0008D93443|nr:DUF6746 family protein [Halofilum ochraceum]